MRFFSLNLKCKNSLKVLDVHLNPFYSLCNQSTVFNKFTLLDVQLLRHRVWFWFESLQIIIVIACPNWKETNFIFDMFKCSETQFINVIRMSMFVNYFFAGFCQIYYREMFNSFKFSQYGLLFLTSSLDLVRSSYVFQAKHLWSAYLDYAKLFRLIYILINLTSNMWILYALSTFIAKLIPNWSIEFDSIIFQSWLHILIFMFTFITSSGALRSLAFYMFSYDILFKVTCVVNLIRLEYISSKLQLLQSVAIGKRTLFVSKHLRLFNVMCRDLYSSKLFIDKIVFLHFTSFFFATSCFCYAGLFDHKNVWAQFLLFIASFNAFVAMFWNTCLNNNRLLAKVKLKLIRSN